MADDIVTRLRVNREDTLEDWWLLESVFSEAADEIERLREDRDRWKALGQHICEFHYNLIPDHIHQLFDDYNKAVRGE
jgi:hypothetical protein